MTDNNRTKPNIQWFPGHMARAGRILKENLKLIDRVVLLLDARIPAGSMNREFDRIFSDKTCIYVLNKADLADENITIRWKEYFEHLYPDSECYVVDSRKGTGIKEFINGVKKSMESEINREKSKGRIFRPIRIMAAGIPNVGKSSFINRIAGKSGAITGDKPGVTKGRQWIKINPFIELLDTPGILQPRYDSRETGLLLAYTGAIKDDIFDKTEVASLMMSVIAVKYPGMISGRYGIKAETVTEPLKLLEEAAIKRGCLMHGGETDLERMASLVLDEFRAGKIGRITLEEPENHQ